MKSFVFLLVVLLSSYRAFAQENLAQHLLDSVAAANPRTLDPGLLKMDQKYSRIDHEYTNTR